MTILVPNLLLRIVKNRWAGGRGSSMNSPGRHSSLIFPGCDRAEVVSWFYFAKLCGFCGRA
jgi:hypothetical protein